MNRATLLITGSIDLKQVQTPSTVIRDTGKRLKQYLDAIEYAIDHYTEVETIIFCENTNFDFNYTPLREKAEKKGKNLEILTFAGNYEMIYQRGKGYGEGEIIDYALNNSYFLSKTQSFYKLTGRLIIKNMDQLIRTTHSANAFWFKPIEITTLSKRHIETFFYKTETELYQSTLRDAYLSVDEVDNIYLEHLFFDRLNGLKVRNFNSLPQLSGESGTSGKKYDLNGFHKFKIQFYTFTGAYHLYKTLPEKIAFAAIAMSLKIFRTIK